MNEIKIFDNQDFGQVRVAMDREKALFYGPDVVVALGCSNPCDAIAQYCRGVAKHDVGVEIGKKADGTLAKQVVNMSFSPGDNVYRLIIRSRLSTAEKFEHWVVDEILPSIRKAKSQLKKENYYE